MKTVTRSVEELLKVGNADEAPLPLGVIPNYMGINLCSVEGMTWTRQDDGQLVSLTIHFIPAIDGLDTVAGQVKQPPECQTCNVITGDSLCRATDELPAAEECPHGHGK